MEKVATIPSSPFPSFGNATFFFFSFSFSFSFFFSRPQGMARSISVKVFEE